MQLTKSQRRALEIYRWYHTHAPTWQFYLMTMMSRSYYLIYLGIVALAGLLLVISRATGLSGWLYLPLGMIIGATLRNLRAYHQTIRLWPALDRIIDWDKVEALLTTREIEN